MYCGGTDSALCVLCVLCVEQYRDFVFRKMFEKPAIAFEARADEIVRNVQELTRLDPR